MRFTPVFLGLYNGCRSKPITVFKKKIFSNVSAKEIIGHSYFSPFQNSQKNSSFFFRQIESVLRHYFFFIIIFKRKIECYVESRVCHRLITWCIYGAAGRMKVNDLGRAPKTEVMPEKVVPVWGYKTLDICFCGWWV